MRTFLHRSSCPQAARAPVIAVAQRLCATPPHQSEGTEIRTFNCTRIVRGKIGTTSTVSIPKVDGCFQVQTLQHALKTRRFPDLPKLDEDDIHIFRDEGLSEPLRNKLPDTDPNSGDGLVWYQLKGEEANPPPPLIAESLCALSAVDEKEQRVFTHLEDALANYDADACSASSVGLVQPSPNSRATDRQSRIFLVMGPSGSGKSIYAYRYLHDQLCAVKWKQHVVTLHVRVTLLGEGRINVEWAVSNHEKTLKRVDCSTTLVHFIFDEAGGAYASIKTEGDLEKLREETRGQVAKLCTNSGDLELAISIVGTGVDKATREVNSASNGICKIRLRPWNSTHATSYINKAYATGKEEQRELLRSCLDKAPVNALISNARCAAYVLREIANINHFSDLPSWRSYLLFSVCHQYASSNGFRDVREASDRRSAVGGVMQALEFARKHSSKKSVLKQLMTKEWGHRSNLLMQLNIETKTTTGGTTYSLAGDASTPVEVSPALALVMCHLMRMYVEVTGNFSTCAERIVAAQLVLLNAISTAKDARSETNKRNSEVGTTPASEADWQVQPAKATQPSADLVECISAADIVKFASQGNLHEKLHSKDGVRVNLPVIALDRVFDIGGKSPSCDALDVIRMVQVKTATGKDPTELPLVAELIKMGVLAKETRHKLPTATANDACKQWVQREVFLRLRRDMEKARGKPFTKTDPLLIWFVLFNAGRGFYVDGKSLRFLKFTLDSSITLDKQWSSGMFQAADFHEKVQKICGDKAVKVEFHAVELPTAATAAPEASEIKTGGDAHSAAAAATTAGEAEASRQESTTVTPIKKSTNVMSVLYPMIGVLDAIGREPAFRDQCPANLTPKADVRIVSADAEEGQQAATTLKPTAARTKKAKKK